MNKERYNRQNFLIYILYIAIILSLTSLIVNVIELDLKFSSQIIIVIIISTIVKVFMIYPLTLLISLVLAAWASYFIIKYKPLLFLSIQEKVIILYFNILANLSGSQAILEENRLFIYLTILVLISLFTAIIVYRLKYISLLIPIYLIIFLTYWYSFIDESYIFTGIFIFLFLILFGLKKYKLDIINNKKMFNSWATTSIVYSVLIVSIAFFIPKPNDFLSWPSLQQNVYDRFPIVEDLRYYKDYDRKSSNANFFNFSRSGFSTGDSLLGGPLVLSERKIMTVETDTPLYLRGNVKHIYTGKSWENMSFSPQEYNLNQDLSFLLDSEKDAFYKRKSATINFDSFSSMTIFAPYKIEKIISNRNFSLVANNDDILTSTDGTYRKESYIVEYLKPLPYQVLVSKGMNKRLSELMDLDLYLELPDDEASFYIQSPQVSITDRTKDLTKTIVKDINKDYEKAIAIQNYLRDNYKYNLDVPQLPKDQEFVDHFLFETKEGYCTYYASAMAVMLRLEGIPTRYIEGYVVDEKIEANKYQVRQKHAHAWVEAFIEPVGWTNFEPTAAYDDLRRLVKEEDDDDINPDIVEELAEEVEKPDLPVEVSDPIEKETNIDVDISKPNNMLKTLLFFIILMFLLFTSIRIFIRNLKYKKKEKHLNSLSNKEKVSYIYKDIIDLLDILGFSQRSGQTHFDYANRIFLASNDLKIQEIKDITSLFVKLKYSDIKAEDEDVLIFLNYKDELDKKLRVHLGKINYLYRKFINLYFINKKEIP